ncbi:MAG: SDR family oxidoreductase [Planctomycetes bacterium]|nr:SDR family oxidoreductase [Planctomycetota bacterium]
MNTSLAGTVQVVTGASGGIGAAVARAFVAEGARVVLHHHRGGERAAALASELGGRRATLARADLTDERDVDAMWERIVATHGRVDGVVVNAGIWIAEEVPVCDMSLAQWRHTLDTDLTSAFLTCRGFLRHLKAVPRDDASIVLIGSTAALFGEAGHADYSAAKAAMSYGLTRSLKNEIVRVAPRGRVNCVCPGWVATPMAEDALRDPGVVHRATCTMPMRKVAQPEDVASMVVALASPALGAHVSGVVLPVHGGMEGRLLHP